MKRVRALGVVVVMMTACGGGATAPVAPIPSASSSATADSSDAGIAVAPSASAPVMPSPPPTPLPRAVILPYGDDETLLFADERARVVDVVRDRFSKQTVQPVDVLTAVEMAQLNALVAAGRVREGGPVCAVPPSLEHVVNARLPEARAIMIDLRCESSTACVARAEMRRWARDGNAPHWGFFREWDTLARIVANVPSSSDVALFERALGLAPATPFAFAADDHRARHAASQLASSTVSVVADLATTDWASPPTAATFASKRAEIEACAKSGRLAGDAVISVDGAGAIERCEPTPRTPAMACACAAFATIRYPAGSPHRRVRFHVAPKAANGATVAALTTRTPPPSPRPFANVDLEAHESELETSDAIALSKIGVPLTACFTRAATAHRDSTRVDLERDDGGHVVSTHVAASSAFSATETACVETALKSLALPCPLSTAGRRLALTLDVDR